MRESVPSGVLASVLRPAFVASTIAWALLLPLAPFVAAQPHPAPVSRRVPVCRLRAGSGDLPSAARSGRFTCGRAQMPVCARCAGIYVGAAIAAIVATSIAPLTAAPYGCCREAALQRRCLARRSSASPRRPTLITLVYEWTTGHMPVATGSARPPALPLGADRRVDGPVRRQPRRTRAENQVN